jgi:hypothetical protein
MDQEGDTAPVSSAPASLDRAERAAQQRPTRAVAHHASCVQACRHGSSSVVIS